MFCLADLVEDCARRWVFFDKMNPTEMEDTDRPRAASRTSWHVRLSSKLCSVSAGVLKRFISTIGVGCLGAGFLLLIAVMHVAQGPARYVPWQVISVFLSGENYMTYGKCPS